MNHRGTGVLVIGFYADLVADLLRSGAAGRLYIIEEPDLLAGAAHAYSGDPRVEFAPGRYQQSFQAVDVAVDIYRKHRYEIVIPGREYGVRTAHRIAEKLGLPTSGGVCAEASTDKLLLRELTDGTGLCHGRYAPVTGAADVRRMFDGRELIIKPRSRHGSLGVVRVRRAEEIESQWNAALSSARHGAVTAERELRWEYLAEDFVTGFAEVSVESVVSDEEIIFSNITLKSMSGGHHYSPTGHIVPCPLRADELGSLNRSERRLLAMLGMRAGIIHSEWICRGDAPHLVEFAVRYPGGKLARAIDAVYGVNLADLWVGAMLGRRRASDWHPRGFAGITYVTAAPGVITGVRGEDFLGRTPWIIAGEISALAGRSIHPMQSFTDRLGYYICVAPSPAVLARRMSAAAAEVAVITE